MKMNLKTLKTSDIEEVGKYEFISEKIILELSYENMIIKDFDKNRSWVFKSNDCRLSLYMINYHEDIKLFDLVNKLRSRDDTNFLDGYFEEVNEFKHLNIFLNYDDKRFKSSIYGELDVFDFGAV